MTSEHPSIVDVFNATVEDQETANADYRTEYI